MGSRAHGTVLGTTLHIGDLVPGTDVYTAALDRGLNDRTFIPLGLGDFGDRLYGT